MTNTPYDTETRSWWLYVLSSVMPTSSYKAFLEVDTTVCSEDGYGLK